MRLINADKLRAWFESYSVWDVFSNGYIMGLIDEQPTVEAISVEWIEERIKVVNASAMRASSMGQHSLALRYYAESVSLNDLLKDWAEQRKEDDHAEKDH